jgi:hypothetical protein
MTAYRYRLNPAAPAVIQVRRHVAGEKRNNRKWRTYMCCSSPERAAQILRRLRQPPADAWSVMP